MSGNGSRPVSRGDKRRDDLLAALEVALRTSRLEDVSVGALTQSAGVTRSAFYFYFDSKAMAVMDLLSTTENEAELSNHRIMTGDGPLRERMRSVLERLGSRITAFPHVYRAALEARYTDRAVAELWEHDRMLLVRPIADWIRAERAAGTVAGGVDADLLADMLTSLNESLLERLADSPDDDHGPLLETVAEMWVRSIQGCPDAPPKEPS